MAGLPNHSEQSEKVWGGDETEGRRRGKVRGGEASPVSSSRSEAPRQRDVRVVIGAERKGRHRPRAPANGL